MIQKKKFSDAIAANISVVGGLLPVESTDYNGLADKRYSYISFIDQNLQYNKKRFFRKNIIAFWTKRRKQRLSVVQHICSFVDYNRNIGGNKHYKRAWFAY